MNVRPNELKQFIKQLYLSFVNSEMPSVIILGPPGIGKTIVIQEVAKELAMILGRTYVDFSTIGTEMFNEIIKNPEKYFVFVSFAATHVEPIDMSGIPRVIDGDVCAKYVLLDYMHVLTQKNIAGILFIDEFTTDPRVDRRSSELKLINEQMAGFRKFSHGVMVIAAGNTKKFSMYAEELDEPMRRGRAVILFAAPPTIDEWREWMESKYGDGWDRRVYAFLRLYPQKFFTLVEEGKESADVEAGYRPLNSPRNWTRLAVILHRMPENADMVISGLVDAETAVLLSNFIKTVIPDWKTLRKWPTSEKIEVRYLLVSQMVGTVLSGESIDEELVDSKIDFICSMDNESLALFLAMLSQSKRAKFLALVMRKYPQLFAKLKTIAKDVAEVSLQ